MRSGGAGRGERGAVGARDHGDGGWHAGASSFGEKAMLAPMSAKRKRRRTKRCTSLFPGAAALV